MTGVISVESLGVRNNPFFIATQQKDPPICPPSDLASPCLAENPPSLKDRVTLWKPGLGYIARIQNGINNCWLISALHILAAITHIDHDVLHQIKEKDGSEGDQELGELQESLHRSLLLYSTYYEDNPKKTEPLDPDQQPELVDLFARTRRRLHLAPQTPGVVLEALHLWLPSKSSLGCDNGAAFPLECGWYTDERPARSAAFPSPFRRKAISADNRKASLVAEIIWHPGEGHYSTILFKRPSPHSFMGSVLVDSRDPPSCTFAHAPLCPPEDPHFVTGIYWLD